MFDAENQQVLRWDYRGWRERKWWAETLETRFSERASDAIHMVFFDANGHDDRSLRTWLAEIKQRISTPQRGHSKSVMNKYGIQQIWIGRKVSEQDVKDKVYRGRISATLTNVEPYVLFMKFSSEDGLERYDGDKEHSDIRRSLFQKLDSRIKVLYEATDSGPLANGNNKAVAYEAIEAIAGRYIHRRDYLDDEMILEVVGTEPYQF